MRPPMATLPTAEVRRATLPQGLNLAGGAFVVSKGASGLERFLGRSGRFGAMWMLPRCCHAIQRCQLLLRRTRVLGTTSRELELVDAFSYPPQRDSEPRRLSEGGTTPGWEQAINPGRDSVAA